MKLLMILFYFLSISGRSTHVSKLRTEFDSGADYDLRECGPGEIDPHAVSSILKAYLREREYLISIIPLIKSTNKLDFLLSIGVC